MSVHTFRLPSGPELAAMRASGMTWAHCNDDARTLREAVVVFHIGAVPLDTAGARYKCMGCGARSEEGAAA